MSTVRFAIYANDPFGLNYYSPQYNTADTADKTYEGNVLLTQDAVDTAIATTTAMLVNAPFTDILMGFFGLANTVTSSPWYNYPTPVITWNGVPITQINTPSGWTTPNQPWGIAPSVAQSLQQIVQSGKNLIASMQNVADLIYIQNNWSVADFYTAFSEQVLVPLHFSGLDLDMESQWSTYASVLIDLSNTFAQNGYLVTHAPYGYLNCSRPSGMLSFYLCKEQSQPLAPLVGQTVIQNGSGQKVNAITWLNNQYYSGGDQGDAASTVSQYIVAANAAAAIPNSGITDPNYFCLAGFAPVICDPQYELWNQFMSKEAEHDCQNGSIQCDPCNNSSGVYVMDAVNGLVSHFGKDASGLAQFGGVFIYSYRYYNATQTGYSYQVSMWNTIATALGLVK